MEMRFRLCCKIPPHSCTFCVSLDVPEPPVPSLCTKKERLFSCSGPDTTVPPSGPQQHSNLISVLICTHSPLCAHWGDDGCVELVDEGYQLTGTETCTYKTDTSERSLKPWRLGSVRGKEKRLVRRKCNT